MSAHKDGIWRELYPFQSYVRMLDGHRFHYLDEGKGPVLLMVHGNPTWSFYWRNLILAFRDRFRVVVPDHIGCGLSGKPQNYPYTLSQHVRNLRWLVEQLDLKDITLLAHDWGGAIGLGTAVAMPNRFGRFVLFNTAAFRDTRIPLRIATCRIPFWGAFSVRALNGFARAALTWATEKPERMTAAVKAGLIAPYDSWANRIATHRFVQDIPLKPSHPSYGTLASIEAGLAQFRRRPVQFIWGMKDWCFTPHFLERFVDEFFPDAEVNPIDDAGHYVVEDAYEQIIPLVEDFLTRHGVLKGKKSPDETWKKSTNEVPEPPAEEPPRAESPHMEAPRAAPPIRGTAQAFEMPDEPAEEPLASPAYSQPLPPLESPRSVSGPFPSYTPAPAYDPEGPAPLSASGPLPSGPLSASSPSLAPLPTQPPEVSSPAARLPSRDSDADVDAYPFPRMTSAPLAPAPPAAPQAKVDEFPFPRMTSAPMAPAPQTPAIEITETGILPQVPSAPSPPAPSFPSAPAPRDTDEFPFPRMGATTPAPAAPRPAEPPEDEYAFPRMAPAPLTPASQLAPATPPQPAPLAPYPSEPAQRVEPHEQPIAESPKTRDPAIGETRLPEDGATTFGPPATAETPNKDLSGPLPKVRDPAIGETRLPEDDATPLGAQTAPSAAADQIIRDSKPAIALDSESRDSPSLVPADATSASSSAPPSFLAAERAQEQSPAGFTPEMVRQATVMSMRPPEGPPAKSPPPMQSPIAHIAREATPSRESGETRTSPVTPVRTGRQPAPPPEPVPSHVVNVALRLRRMASIMPEALAVIAPAAHDENGKRVYDRITFSQLDRVSDRLARGLKLMGVEPGTRLALMVPPGIQFVALVFALFKAGVVTILIDPGMGRKNLLKCLAQAQPQGFVGIPLVHKLRRLLFWRFRKAKFNVVVGGHKPVAGTLTFDQLRGGTWNGHVLTHTKTDDPAAIIFTTGSTGPPKGVLYRHGNFNAQVEELQEFYRIGVGEVSLSGFPLFTLFDAAMGVTSVIPDMDPTRPAHVDPRNILEAVNDLRVTQAFASPAMWNTVGRYCETQQATMPTLKRVLSAGAPVPQHVLERMRKAIAPDGDVHTPYGATEALPVASIGARELLPDLAAKTRQGAGVCVGRRFGGIQWRVIRIVDGPLPTIDDAQELSAGEIGELIVTGEVVTREYYGKDEATRWAKLAAGGVTRSGFLSGPSIWHRMGDVGYLDEAGRFWYCGRMAHRVRTPDGTLYTEPCEAIFNTHPLVYRSALVGVGRPGKQKPVIIVEPHPGQMPKGAALTQFLEELRQLARANPKTERIEKFLLHPSLPVDIRHNSKIFREKLARWARWRVW